MGVTQTGTVPTRPNPTQEAAEIAAARASRGFKRSFYVDSINGYDGAGSNGSPRSPLATMARAFALAQSFDQIVFRGVIAEEVTPSNLLGGISIIGAEGRPRHSDAPWRAGNLWKPPAVESGTTPLLKIRGQGYYLENFLMDAPTDAACVELERNALAGSAEYDASHFSCDGMRFVGGQSGIEIDGGAFNVAVRNSVFQALTNGIKCLSTSVSVPLAWLIENNQFYGECTNEIISSFVDSIIKGNRFHDLGSTVHINTKYNSGQGARNHVIHNYFPETNANIKEDDGYLGTATDYWRNFATGTAAEVVESPPGAS